MFATIAYFTATLYGAQITPYALVATTTIDLAFFKTVKEWRQAKAWENAEFVPIEGDVEVEPLDADEVEERYGGN